MRKTLLLLLMLPFIAPAQTVPGLLIAKLNSETASHGQHWQENGVLQQLSIRSIEQKYPHAEPIRPGATNADGLPLTDLSRTYRLVMETETDLNASMEKLMSTGFFEWVEPTTYAESFYNPNDPQVGTLDHLAHANIYAAWDTTQGDTNVVIGMTDTSFDLDHEDLQDNTRINYEDPVNGLDDDNDGYVDNYRGWDIWGDDNNVFYMNDWHGTGVLAVSSATTDNGVGMAGVGFKCKYLPVKIANDNTNGNTTIVTADGHDAIVYCADRDCKVINCSWGTLTSSNDGQDVVNYATINKDAVVVAAAGNTFAEEFRYPASFAHAVSVTGVNNDDRFDNGSNTPFTYNDSVDVCAQGFNVMATATVGAPGSNEVYQTTGGTSIAAPIVSGGLALIRSAFPCISALTAVELLTAYATDIEDVGNNATFSGKIGKRIDIAAAMQEAPCLTTGRNEPLTERDGFLLYPNPSSADVHFRFAENDDRTLSIYGMDGRLIRSVNVPFSTLTVSGLPSGSYSAVVIGERGVSAKRFTIIR